MTAAMPVPDEARIRAFRPGDEQGVIDLILPIQREEFGLAITAADQPDLRTVPAFYQTGRGAFLVAESGNRIVGTIGMKDIGEGNGGQGNGGQGNGGQGNGGQGNGSARSGALRKMFVAADHRGSGSGLAGRLLHAVLDLARENGLHRIFLGTTDRFLAAHRFYEKHGFMPVPPADLPQSFPRMNVDTRFYRLDLPE